MLIVQGKLVGDEVIQQHFLCNLNACKGACCWEGDFGAPLEKQELVTLEKIYKDIKPFLTEDGIAKLEEKGLYEFHHEENVHGTTLLDNAACAYMTRDEKGIAKCGMEAAYNAGVTDFRKPISCHLYPIRVTVDEHTDFEAINYEAWDICSAACDLGKKEQLPVYKFVKDAIVRKYGEDFYEELDAAAEYMEGE